MIEVVYTVKSGKVTPSKRGLHQWWEMTWILFVNITNSECVSFFANVKYKENFKPDEPHLCLIHKSEKCFPIGTRRGVKTCLFCHHQVSVWVGRSSLGLGRISLKTFNTVICERWRKRRLEKRRQLGQQLRSQSSHHSRKSLSLNSVGNTNL